MEKALSVEASLNLTLEKEVVEEKPLGFREKAKRFFSNITVEPIILFYILPSSMAMIATQNLSLEKACRVNLAFDEEVCDALASRNASGYNETDEIAVQKLAATLYAWKNVVQSVIPFFLLLFVGSWSDRHNSRKPCIIVPIVGEVISAAGFLLCTFFFLQLSAEFVVFFESFPPAIAGGWATSFMGLYSYICSISTLETRTLRIGSLSLFSSVSSTIGVSLSGILFKFIGYYGVFSLSLSMYIIAVAYGSWRVKEPKDDGAKNPEKGKKVGFLRDFFNWKYVADTFRVVFKKGDTKRNVKICTILVLVVVVLGPQAGEWNIMYLYVRYKFGWNGLDYSIFSTFVMVTNTVGTMFSLMFFSKYLKLDDTLLGFISSTSKILSSLVFAFAPTSLIFYLGPIVEMLNGTSFIAMRSLISKLAPPNELGKTQALISAAEAIVPVIYSPMYSLVYRSTISFLPGCFFLVGGALTLPALAIFMWLYFENKKDLKENAKMAAQKETLLKDKEAAQSC